MNIIKEFAKGEQLTQIVKKDNSFRLLSKVRINNYINLVYISLEEGKSEEELKENFTLNNSYLLKIGIYNKKDERFYLSTQDQKILQTYELENIERVSSVERKITHKIEQKVLELINDRIENLNFNEKELSQDVEKRLKHVFNHYQNLSNMYQEFFEGKKKYTLSDFIYNIFVPNLKTIDYITIYTEKYKREYILKKAKAYIESNKEYLYFCLKKIEVMNNSLKKLYADKNHFLHKKKAIMKAVEGAKEVTITLTKGNKEFDFQTATYPFLLVNNHDAYDSWWITGEEKNKYYSIFSCDYYNVNDIQKITNKGKTIYIKQQF